MNDETLVDKTPNPMSTIELLTMKYNAGRKELLSGMQPGVGFDELFGIIVAIQVFKAAAQQTLQTLITEQKALDDEPEPGFDPPEDVLGDQEVHVTKDGDIL